MWDDPGLFAPLLLKSQPRLVVGQSQISRPELQRQLCCQSNLPTRLETNLPPLPPPASTREEEVGEVFDAQVFGQPFLGSWNS